jgi:protein tyrosine phosphatase domain-containing protein 1
MQYTTDVERRKVAVHCHAGLGRTGLAAACFLLASGRAASGAAAVELVRVGRPGALQTAAQVLFVSIFEQYLAHLRCVRCARVEGRVRV